MKISLRAMIEELETEVKFRNERIEKLRKSIKRQELGKEELRLARLEAAIGTLKFIELHEDVYRELVVKKIRDNAPAQGQHD